MSQIYDSYFSHAMVDELNKLAAGPEQSDFAERPSQREGNKALGNSKGKANKPKYTAPAIKDTRNDMPEGYEFPDSEANGGKGCSKRSSGVGAYYNDYQNLMNYLYR